MIIMKIRFSKILPPKGHRLPQFWNILQAVIYFGVWVAILCIMITNAGHDLVSAYNQSCIIAFALNLAMSQLSYPHKAGGKNPALESNENMQDKHTRFLHNALKYASLYVFWLVTGWVAAWLFANYLALPWHI